MAASTTPSSPSAASESAPPAAAVEVYVGNIPFKTNETQLEELFKPFGQVAHSKIIRRRGRSLGYGFVGFVLQTDAEKAVAALHNSQYEERPITVEIATSVASSPPSSSSSTSVSSSTSSSSSSPPPSSSSSRSSRDVHNETFVALAQFFEWYEQVWQPQEGGTKYQVSEDTMYTLLFHKFFLHLGYVLPAAAAERGLREFNGASEKKLVSIFRLLSRTELVRQVRQHIKGNQQRNILALVSSLGARQLLYIETINDVKQVFFPDLKRLNAFSIEFGLFCHHFYAFLQLFHNLFYHKHPRTPYINKLPLLPVDLSPDSSSSSSSSAPAATTPRASSSDPPAASPSTANNEPTTSSTPGENSTTAVDEHGHHHHPHHRHHHGHGHGHAHGHGHGHGHHHHHQHNADHHARRATSPAKTSPTLPSKASIPRHNPAGRIYQQPQRRH